MIRIRSTFAALLALAAACGRSDEPLDRTFNGLPSAEQAAMPAPSDPAARPDTAWALRMDGIGPIRVGMTFDEARAALGGDLRMSGNVIGTEEGPERCDHPRSGRLPEGVLVMVEGRRVVRVEVNSGSVVTA